MRRLVVAIREPRQVGVVQDESLHRDLVEDAEAPFDVDDYVRWRLMEGLDDIGITLTSAAEIDEFERNRPAFTPTTTAVM